MALLRITIGNVTATRNVADSKAATIAELFYQAVVLPAWPGETPRPETAQERLQAVVDHLALSMRDTAREYRLRELRAENDVNERIAVSEIDL